MKEISEVEALFSNSDRAELADEKGVELLATILPRLLEKYGIGPFAACDEEPMGEQVGLEEECLLA